MKSILSLIKRFFTLLITLLFIQSSFSQTIDSSFGINGLQTLPVDNDFVNVNSIHFQGSKILLSVSDDDGDHYYPEVDIFRLTKNGAFDSSFGNSNVTGLTLIKTLVGGHLFVQPDNKFLVVGRISDRSDVVPVGTVAIYRFMPNGKPDNSFGKKGSFSTLLMGFSIINNVVIKSNGKILASGSLQTTSGKLVRFIQLTANGILDSSFGSNGFVYQESAYEKYCNDLKMLPTGKILAGCTYDSGKDVKTSLIRYTQTGKIDSGFGVNGFVINNNYSIKYGIIKFTITNQNKILAFVSDSTKRAIIFRYKTDGELDESFGDHGKVLVAAHYNPYKDPYYFIATDSANRILVNEGIPNETIARYKENGTVDSSFGDYGKIASTSVSSLMLVQPNGKLLIFGVPGLIDPVIERYKFDHSSAVLSGAEQSQKSAGNIVSVYPNPVKDVLHVTGLDNTKNYDVEITNTQGTVIATKHIAGSYDFDVRQLSAGVYYLSIISNGKTVTTKFVKE